MNPTGMRKIQLGWPTTRSASSVEARPMMTHAVMFTTNVPQGNPAGTRAWTKMPTW
jgi:hypothetical protein